MTRADAKAVHRGGPFGIRPGLLFGGVVVGALVAPFAARAAGPLRVRGPLADSVATAVEELADRANVGVLAVSLDRGDTLVALDESRRFIPGSNTKVFTTSAFLRSFGPEARFPTTLEARGKADRGKRGAVRLKGDLILRPAGVPDVVPILAPGSRGLIDSLAFLARAGGLERFEGTIWVDGTLFAEEPFGPGWEIEDVPYSYGAPPAPVFANGNAATLFATGGPKGVALTIDPPETPLTLRSDAVVVDAATGAIDVHREPESHVLYVTGAVPRGATLKKQVSVPDPDSTAGLWLIGAMRRAGIDVSRAQVRLVPHEIPAASDHPAATPRHDGAPPPAAPADTGWAAVTKERPSAVVSFRSPPAAAMVGVVLELSLNPEAEGLLRLLDPASREKRREAGLVAERQAAARAGIDTLDLSLVDGSGLSPQNLATPRSLVGWMAALARDSTLAGPFRAALATPGENGTLKRRFAGLPPGADLRAKSGTLTNVSSLSGYVTTAAGERIAFAIMTNGNRGSVASAKQLEERIVGMLARRGGAAAEGFSGSVPPRIPR
ncbi:MAG: D-alanyl-D-alanine carboxypeptidase/D-alanyl-D-alanine-endopeptidase [Bacteroidota bacterium]